ncbi:MAG: tetratricopeptide repeat protein [Candidatus Sumerlaeaceae bacterium]|nr:tetratricopeptide repeat protein [Candidatus Sumerlaeaceae bacterium]
MHTQGRGNIAALGAITAVCIVMALFADTAIKAGLDADRYSLMESLVERGTSRVEGATFPSIDWVKIDGQFYSGKPPLLSVAGAGVYWAFRAATGWTLKEHPDAFVRMMICIFVILPYLGILWLFWSRFLPPSLPLATKWGLLLVLAAASLLLPYAKTFSNHLLAAFLLLAALLSGIRGRDFAVGLLAGLSAAVDLIPGTCFGLGWVICRIARKSPVRQWALSVAGAALPLGINAALNYATIGSIWPAYLLPNALNYEGSLWITPASPSSDYETFSNYGMALFHFTFGHRGVFVFMPLLPIGISSWVQLLRSGDPQETGLKSTAAATLTAIVGTILLTPKFSLGLAGGAYGPRHIIPVIPIAYAGMPLAWPILKQGVRRILVPAFAVWSGLLAAIGSIEPWTPNTLSVYAPLEVAANVAAKSSSGWSDFSEQIIDHTAWSRDFAYYEIGRTYASAGKPAEAVMAFRRSVTINPNRALAYYHYGTLAGSLGAMKEAATAFQKLVSLEPDNGGGWSNLGLSLLAMGQTDNARSALERGLEINPNSRGALIGMIRISRQQGNTSGTQGFIERLERLEGPGSAEKLAPPPRK